MKGFGKVSRRAFVQPMIYRPRIAGGDNEDVALFVFGPDLVQEVYAVAVGQPMSRRIQSYWKDPVFRGRLPGTGEFAIYPSFARKSWMLRPVPGSSMISTFMM